MLASELIRHLQVLIDAHGDRVVRYGADSLNDERWQAEVDGVDPIAPRSLGDSPAFLLS
jgi:hypothetical protein